MLKRGDDFRAAARPPASSLDLFAQDETRDGQARHFFLGVLEAAFRRPLALIVPVLLFGALGAYLGLGADRVYESSGVITSTQDGILDTLEELSDNPVSYETSATVTARSLGDLLETDYFIDQVITNAGLTSAIESKQLTRDDVRDTIVVEDAGDDLVRVVVTSPRAEQSYRTATAVLRSFVDYRIDQSRQETSVAIDNLQSRYDESYAELLAVQGDLNDYVAGHPVVSGVDPPLQVALDIASYNDRIDELREIVRDDRTTLNNAINADASAEQIESARFRTIDVPQQPEEPEPRLKAAVITTAAFAFFGALVGVALMVLISLFDRTVRTPNDISRRFDLDVVAVLPKAKA